MCLNHAAGAVHSQYTAAYNHGVQPLIALTADAHIGEKATQIQTFTFHNIACLHSWTVSCARQQLAEALYFAALHAHALQFLIFELHIQHLLCQHQNKEQGTRKVIEN